MSDLIERIERRLKSANSVPVERTYITADEWAAIAKTLREKLSESGEITRLQSEVERLRGRCGELEVGLYEIECFGHGPGHGRGYTCGTMAQRLRQQAAESEK